MKPLICFKDKTAIKGCTDAGSTLATTTTASGSKITGYTFKTFIIDPANTASKFVDASHRASLTSILATETLASETNRLTSSSFSIGSTLGTVTRSSSSLPSSSPLTSSSNHSTSSLPLIKISSSASLSSVSSKSTSSNAVSSPTPEATIYMYYSLGGDSHNGWNMYLSKVDANIDPCKNDKTQLSDPNLTSTSEFPNIVFPTGSFNLPKGKGADGCTYHGDGKGRGKMTCGNASLDCGKDPISS